jgi:uncharacterized alpha-E superfamily protein
MLARIARELYWVGRYLARAEHTARMLDGVFQADLQGRPEAGGVLLSWEALLTIMGAGRAVDGEHPGWDGLAAQGVDGRDEALDVLTLDRGQGASVITCVERAREGAAAVRDVISAEMWEAVNTFALTLRAGDLSARMRTGPYSVYQHVKERCALFWGLADRTMLRDDAQAFLLAGDRIESADMMLRMLRVALPPVADEADEADVAAPLLDGHALALLQAVGGYQAYRRAVVAPPNAGPVARFLLFDRGYPNSVASSVEMVHDSLVVADADPRRSPPVLRLSRLSADLDFRHRAGMPDGELVAMFEFVQDELAQVDADVAERYFAGAAGAARGR